VKLSNKPKHFAPRNTHLNNKNHPGHISSGKGNAVSISDPFALLLGIVPFLKRIRRTQ
jgi:hypothetical protein